MFTVDQIKAKCKPEQVKKLDAMRFDWQSVVTAIETAIATEVPAIIAAIITALNPPPAP